MKDLNLTIDILRFERDMKQQEIERLNNDLGDMTKLFAKEREQTIRLNNIIKEVREFIEKYSIMYEHEIEPYKVVESEELLEILDKGE